MLCFTAVSVSQTRYLLLCAGRASRLGLPLPVQLALENCSPESTHQSSPQDTACGPWGTVTSQILEFVPITAPLKQAPTVAAHAIPVPVPGTPAAAAAYSHPGPPGGNLCYSRDREPQPQPYPQPPVSAAAAVASTAMSAELHVAVPPMGFGGPQFENPTFSSLSASALSTTAAPQSAASASADGTNTLAVPYSSATLQLHPLPSAPLPHARSHSHSRCGSVTAAAKSNSLAALSVPPQLQMTGSTRARESFLPKARGAQKRDAAAALVGSSSSSCVAAIAGSMTVSQLPALSESPSHSALARIRLLPHRSEPPPPLPPPPPPTGIQKDQQSISTSNYSELSSALQMFTRQIDASCVVVEAVIGRGKLRLLYFRLSQKAMNLLSTMHNCN